MNEQSYQIKLNKQGVSVVIGYVLLIVIAVAISGLVFNYLYLSVPKERPTCENEVTISIREVNCTSGELKVTLFNTGLFKIDAAYFRLKNSATKQVSSLNPSDFLLRTFPAGGTSPKPGLYPDEAITKTFPVQAGSYELEVQPAVFSGDKLALCEGIIKQEVVCIA